MGRKRSSFLTTVAVLTIAHAHGAGEPLDPRGTRHIPIGTADSVDTLKTFVEAEGNFSPGFATYGIYFWLYDRDSRKLTAPTMDDVSCERGLSGTGYLMPWSRWEADGLRVTTEVCQAAQTSPRGECQVVGARVVLANPTRRSRAVSLYAALRPLGAAGGPVRELAVSTSGDALLVDGHPALVAEMAASAAGVMSRDRIGTEALAGTVPAGKKAASPGGDCSGALRFDLSFRAGESKTLGFICPVLPGRRAVGHDWDGTSKWAQSDLAEPNPPAGGALQPDPGLAYYRSLTTAKVFDGAHAYWQKLVGQVGIRVPDPRWAACFAAILGHAAMAMNGGAPDVAVVNYNVFNRDGVYVANILQKSHNLVLAAAAIDYFLAHPFNGRTAVEADNPGQILWVMGEHWRFSRDPGWLERVYPSVAGIAAMIRYYRTTPGPHYVKANSLLHGSGLPPDTPDERPAQRRQVLKPGSCDGHHPEYTEAFDIAGLRAASELAEAAGKKKDAGEWRRLAVSLMASYDKRFGSNLPNGYGNYAVLWPCRLYPYDRGNAYEQFRNNGASKPGGWRYFALANAHQGLLTGNREAGWKTLENHLEHPHMRGWYAFDEGGRSGAGGWKFARTTWKGGVAMPHGWAIAEMWLLLRDSLLFEDENRLLLLPGIPPAWFTHQDGLSVENIPTTFGVCSLTYKPNAKSATLTIGGTVAPPGGFVLPMPPSLSTRCSVERTNIPRGTNGRFILPTNTRRIRLTFGQ